MRLQLGVSFLCIVACASAPAAAQAPKNATAQCRDGVYSTSKNPRGICSNHGGVSRWLVTAQCKDGTLSTSTSRSGTCSGHGGVQTWYATARCKDGSLSGATTSQGACSSHGGVDEWFVQPQR